jgi:hypothetical protein
MPTGPEAYSRLKELGVVVNHRLNTIWEHDVAPKVIAFLDEMGVLWTSVDVVRINLVEDTEPSAPIILWIGVKAKSLSAEDGEIAAYG